MTAVGAMFFVCDVVLISFLLGCYFGRVHMVPQQGRYFSMNMMLISKISGHRHVSLIIHGWLCCRGALPPCFLDPCFPAFIRYLFFLDSVCQNIFWGAEI